MLLWLDLGEGPLGRRSRRRIEEAGHARQLAASAISFWEIAMLVRKGRFDPILPTAERRQGLLAAGITEIPVDGAIGIAAEELADLPGDPADRIIVATALAEGATLLTADQRILDWPGPLVRIDARL